MIHYFVWFFSDGIAFRSLGNYIIQIDYEELREGLFSVNKEKLKVTSRYNKYSA